MIGFMDIMIAQHIPQNYRQTNEGQVIKINPDRPMSEILAQLNQYPIATRLSLSGTIVVARDIAHAKLKEKLGGFYLRSIGGPAAILAEECIKKLLIYVKDYLFYCYF